MSDNEDWRTDRDRPRDEPSRDSRPRDSSPPDSRSTDRSNLSRERMSAQYDDDLPPPRRRKASVGLSSVLGSDELTRRLVYGALGVGGVLALAIGGWSLMGGHQRGIPVLGPPPGPVRDHPADPGGMQIMGGEGADTDTTGQGVARLAPGPEQPRPDALAQQYGQPAPSSASTKAPVPSPPAPTTSAPETAPESAPVPTATLPSPKAPVALPPSVPPPSAQPPSQPTATPTTASVSPPSGNANANGRFMVQLAALDSEAEAHREWDLLSRQAPDLFSDRQPLIERTDRANRSYYRLRLDGFESAQAARAFCIKAHARTIACTPAQF